MKPAKLAIGIAAYNDAKTITSVTEESIRVLSSLTDQYQVLIINDGSQDNTSEVIREIAARFSAVKVVEHTQNAGFGATISETYFLPEGEWVLFIPGDGQIPPSCLLRLYPHIATHDFVLGYRRNRMDPLSRRMNSWCYNWFVSLLAGKRVHDVNSAGLLRREMVLGQRFISKGAFVHAEVLLKVVRKKGRFCEVDIEHKPRLFGEASGNKLSVMWGTLQDVFRYFWTLAFNKTI